MSERFLLASMPAKWTDDLMWHGAQSNLAAPNFAIARLVSSVVFPLFCLLDTLHLSASIAYRGTMHLVTKQGSHLKAFYRDIEHIQRVSLAIITSGWGLIFPDLITQHFIPAPKSSPHYTPYGKLYSSKVIEKHPETIEQIQSIIQIAKTEGKKISIAGASMSQGKQVLPPDEGNYLIHMDHFKNVEVRPGSKTAIVGAGATWADIQRAANPHALAVKVMQASNVFTVGGSLSANCHGWDHHTGSVSQTIRSLEIITADGRLQKVTREDELFKYIVGGYGLMGIVVSVEIDLVDNRELVESGTVIKPQEYLAHFDENVRHNENVAMHLYRLSLDPDHLFEEGVAVDYSFDAAKPDGKVSTLVDEPPRGSRQDRILLHLVRRLGFLRKLGWNREKANALKTQRHDRNQIMRPAINPIFNNSRQDSEWLQEYFVKGEDLPEFLRFLAGVLKENEVPVFNASVRFVKKDNDAVMGYAAGGDRFAIVLFFNQSLEARAVEKTQRWVQQVTNQLLSNGNTYYLPYQHFATKEQFDRAYPAAETFNRKKQELDPSTLFTNGLFEDYIARAGEVGVDAHSLEIATA